MLLHGSREYVGGPWQVGLRSTRLYFYLVILTISFNLWGRVVLQCRAIQLSDSQLRVIHFPYTFSLTSPLSAPFMSATTSRSSAPLPGAHINQDPSRDRIRGRRGDLNHSRSMGRIPGRPRGKSQDLVIKATPTLVGGAFSLYFTSELFLPRTVIAARRAAPRQ